MKDLRFGDFCWYKKKGWQYLGMDEDGCFHLCRPLISHAFNALEFEQVWPSEIDDYDLFCKENGESNTEYCKRKGIEVPK